MPKKFIIKDEEGQQFEVTETDEELTEESSEESKMHDDENRSITIEGDWNKESIDAAKKMGLTFTFTGRYGHGLPVAKVSGNKQKLIKYFKEWYDPDFFEEGDNVFDSKTKDDDESFTSDEIAALKELAERSADLLKLLAVEEDEHEAVGDEDDLDVNDEDVDEKEEVIETKSTDSRQSVGSIEKTRAKDSANFNKEIEIADAWSKRFNKSK